MIKARNGNAVVSAQSYGAYKKLKRSKKFKEVKHYLVGDVIGKGCFGTVKEALDTVSNLPCAVKIVKKKCIPNEVLQKESRILHKLSHKNCISLREEFEEEDKQKWYFVFEYVNGGSLKLLCDRAPNQRIPEYQARRLFSQLLDALEYIHSLGIVHKDIKPDNLLLDANGCLKLSDFGSAVESDCNFCGTCLQCISSLKCNGCAAFQPPEVVSQNASTKFSGPKVDIWAAGVTLYTMVVGCYPFEGKSTSVVQLFQNITNANYTIPSFVSPDFADLITHILEKDYNERFSIQQIRKHIWMTRKLDKTLSLPVEVIPFSTQFQCQKSTVSEGCSCIIL